MQIVLTEENFDSEVKASETPVLVSFCLNSRGYNLETVSSKLGGAFKFGKINVSDEPNLAYRYKIRSLPTMLLFKDGRVTDTIVGVTPAENLIKILE